MNHNRIAVQITKDLGEVVFVGAFAVTSHVGQYRTSRDIDFAMASPLSDTALEERGYRVFNERGKRAVYSKEGVKLDIFTKDVSGIPVDEIFATAVVKTISGVKVRVMCVEVLMLAKLRAARPQDRQDLRQLCSQKGREIRWDLIERLGTSTEITDLRTVVRVFST